MKKIYQILLVAVLVLGMGKSILAADFQASVSSATAVQGENVTVTVTFSSNVNIGAYAMKLTYDANLLEYVEGADGGGGGSIQFYNDYVNATSKSYTISFRTLAAGTAALSFETISLPCDTDANDMTVKAEQGSVNVQPVVSKSGNNNLVALNVALVYDNGSTESVSLSPSFSATETSYQLEIGENVARLSLDVSAEDTKAVVQVSGTRMDPGSNKTTITVTAENGEVKKYIIYTEKKIAAETTTQEMTTEELTQGEETTQEETTQPQETTVAEETTEPETTDDTIIVENESYKVANLPEDYTLPEGYESFTLSYQGSELTVAKGLATNLILAYLVNQETQEGKLFLYEQETDTYQPFYLVTVRQHMYTILDFPKQLSLPFQGTIGQEYKMLTINMDGNSVQALSYDVEDMYLVYAVNWEGEYHLYYYDAKEGSMLRYQYSEMEQKNAAAISAMQPDTADPNDDLRYQKKMTKKNRTIILLLIVIGVLVSIQVIGFVIRKKKISADEYGDEDGDEDRSAYEDYEMLYQAEHQDDKITYPEEAENSTEEDTQELEEEPMDEESLDKELDNILNIK